MPRSIHAFLAGAILAAATAHAAVAAEIAIIPVRQDGAIVAVAGKIAHGDAERVDTALKVLEAKGIPLIAVALNSPGGYFVDGIAMADVVRAHGANTFAWGTCASACFVVFAAGDLKLATRNARLGVHSAYEPGGIVSAPATALMAQRFLSYGVPSSVVAKMNRTPGPRIAWLSRREERAMGVRQVRIRIPG